MLLRRGCRGNVTHALERRRAGLPRQLTRLRRQRQLLLARTGRDTLTQSVACGAEAAHSPIILIIVLVMLQISLLRQFDDHGWPQESFIEEGLIEGWLAVE